MLATSFVAASAIASSAIQGHRHQHALKHQYSKSANTGASLTVSQSAESDLPTICNYPPSTADLEAHTGFITALCSDIAGRTWIATDGNCVYCYDPAERNGSHWNHFTPESGLGEDDVYCLCCDKTGRVWTGTGRSGLPTNLGGPRHRSCYDSLL